MNKETDIGIISKKFSLIKIAIDMHLRDYRVVRQMEYSERQPAQRFAPDGILRVARKATGIGRAGGGMLRSGLLWV